MSPTYLVGDVLLVGVPTGDNLLIGHPVVVGEGSGRYVHRVIERDGDRARLRGDANQVPDPGWVTQDDVSGVVEAHLAQPASIVIVAATSLEGRICLILLLALLATSPWWARAPATGRFVKGACLMESKATARQVQPHPRRRHKGTVRRAVTAAAVACVAVAALSFGGAAAVSAFFTAQASVTSPASTAVVSLQADATAFSGTIAATGLLPGDQASTTVTVTNTGTTPVRWGATVSDITGDPALHAAMTLELLTHNQSGTQSSSFAPLSGWAAGTAFPFETSDILASGESSQLSVTLTLRRDASDTLQGQSTSFVLRVVAVQSRSTDVGVISRGLRDGTL